MSEEKLEKEIETYRELAKQDKKIDIASLMINALQKHESNLLPVKQKRWAYLISLAVPPVGIFFALKFYTSDKDDAKETAMICLLLTAVSILFTIFLAKSLLSGTGANLNNISNLKPQDLQGL